MTTTAITATIYPCLVYQDAPAALEWLCNAFGFEKLLVVPGENGSIAHAELRLGPGVIMVGSVKDGTYRWRSPRELGGVTQTICAYVEDVDGHFARARSAGAEVVREPEDTDYGARGYEVRDPEGHVWYFGNYVPGME
jgi:uncharacterized glyoxalase superfamily protein PhnB